MKQYLNKKFWDVGFDIKSDNIVYVILLTLCLIYFPKGSLPAKLLNKHGVIPHSIKNDKIQGMSYSSFSIPLIGCLSRFTVSYSRPKNRLYTKHFWINECPFDDFDFKVVKEQGRFNLFYFDPFRQSLNVTNQFQQDIDSVIRYAVSTSKNKIEYK